MSDPTFHRPHWPVFPTNPPAAIPAASTTNAYPGKAPAEGAAAPDGAAPPSSIDWLALAAIHGLTVVRGVELARVVADPKNSVKERGAIFVRADGTFVHLDDVALRMLDEAREKEMSR